MLNTNHYPHNSMNRWLLMNILGVCIALMLIFSPASKANSVWPEPLFTADPWNGPGIGTLHQIDANSFITVAGIAGNFGIHRFDMITETREFLIATPLSVMEYSTAPKYVTGNGQTLVDIQGALFITDGTIQGSSLVQDFGSTLLGGAVGTQVSHIASLEFVASQFYVTLQYGNSTDGEQQLWTTDGTPVGTIKAPQNFEFLGEVFSGNNGITYFFGIAEGETQLKIWNYDSNTNVITQVSALPQPIQRNTRTIRTSKGVFFCIDKTLWRFANNTTLSPISSNCSEDGSLSRKRISSIGDSIYYANDTSVWHSQGIFGDAVMIANVNNLGGTSISGLCLSSSKIYFTVEKTTSNLYHVDSSSSPNQINILEKIYIKQCLSEVMVVAIPSINKLGIFNSNIDQLKNIQGWITPSYELTSLGYGLPSSQPTYQDSLFFIAAETVGDDVTFFKTVDFLPSYFLPSILLILD